MLKEDERSWERLNDFDQIIDFNYSYEDGNQSLESVSVDDRLYGVFDFDPADNGDAAIIDVLMSEPLNRLALIEQLTLPEQFATRPETARFSRMEHSIGTMLLARKLGGDSTQQLRALLHDVAQTAFSHLGDWLKQGMDGAGNYHDQIQLEYMRTWGLDTLLEGHGFTLEEIFDPTIQDFVERPAPDLCVDRVDYALREFARWTCPDDVPGLIEELEVKDDMIVFRTHEKARIFEHNYNELYWGHWAHDEHAAKETLFLEAVKHGIETSVITEDDIYSVDQAVLTKLDMWGDEVIWNLFYILRHDLDFTQYRGTAESLRIEESWMEEDEDHLYFLMRGFPLKWVNPSFLDQEDGSRIPLDAVDGDYRSRLALHQEMAVVEYGRTFMDKFNTELLRYVRLKVDPETKKTLSGVGIFR